MRLLNETDVIEATDQIFIQLTIERSSDGLKGVDRWQTVGDKYPDIVGREYGEFRFDLLRFSLIRRPDPVYRLLKAGEIIEDGDEIETGMGWEEIKHIIGDHVLQDDTIRRRI